MWYRRNADTKLRELERRYKQSGSLEDRERYVQERLRMGLGGLEEQIIEILDSHMGAVTHERINIHSSERQFHALIDRYGDNPNHQVINDFLAFEVTYKIDGDMTPDELETVYDDIAERCNLLAWPAILDDLYLPFSGESGYNDRRRIEFFLEESYGGGFDFKKLTSHQAIIDILSPEELEKRFERPLDAYEQEEAGEHTERLHQELDRGRLRRKLYVINPKLMQVTGDVNIRNKGKLLANHMGRYETFLHKVLVELPANYDDTLFPETYPQSPKYVTWTYNIQTGGFATGNRFRANEYALAVEDYLRKVVRID